MRKNTQHAASKGSAFRVARTGVAAASALVVTATGLVFAAPAMAASDHDTIPVVTSPATSSIIYDQYPTFSGTSKANYTGYVYLTPPKGAKFTYCTFTSTAQGTWSCPKPTKPLEFGAYMVDVTVYNKGATSNFAIEDPAKYPFAITTPGFGATVDTNRPVFEGTGLPGGSAIVYSGDVAVAGTKIDAAGNWSAPALLDLPNGHQTIRIDYYTTDLSKVAQSQFHYINVNVAAPTAPVTVTGPAAGATVTEAKPVFAGAGEPGASIVVKDANGVELATTTVGADGTWTATSTVELANGLVTATVSQSIAGAEATTASTSFTVAVAAAVAAELVVVSPANGEEVTTSTPVYSGTGEPGANITVKGSSGKVLAATKVDASGNWSVVSDFELGNGHYVGTVSQSIAGAATSNASLSYSIKVVVAKPFSVTSPLVDAVLGTNTPVFAGVGTPGATVEVRGNSGKVLASTTIDAAGNWSVASQVELGAGRYISYATQIDKGERTVATLQYTVALGISLTTPTNGGEIAGPRPVYTGTAQAGASIQIVGSTGRVVASAVADASGRWTATADFDLAKGRYVGTAAQFVDGVKIGSVAMEYFVK